MPAEFEVTARWNAGKSDTAAPIQWLLVTFPATVGASQRPPTGSSPTARSANPAPARPLNLTQSGNAVTVDTGAAIFRLGANPGALFDEVVLANGTRLIGGGACRCAPAAPATATRRPAGSGSSTQGPLTAIVVVQGAYDAAGRRQRRS